MTVSPEVTWVQSFLTYETVEGRGKGFLRLTETSPGSGEWKAYTFFTTLWEIKVRYPQSGLQTGRLRPQTDNFYLIFFVSIFGRVTKNSLTIVVLLERIMGKTSVGRTGSTSAKRLSSLILAILKFSSSVEGKWF